MSRDSRRPAGRGSGRPSLWLRRALVLSIAVFASWSSATAFANPSGVDVSNYQGSINWGQVANSGRQFDFAKATEGTYFTDGYYSNNLQQASANGLKAGAYHFARPSYDPIAQADYFVSVAKLGPGNLLPVLDLEVTDGLSSQQLISWTHQWLNEVQARLGVKPIIYTYPSFWPSYMSNTTEFAAQGYKLWIANYGVSSPSVPANNWNGSGWAFWQYSDSGSVPGISGQVDEDVVSDAGFGGVTIGGGPTASATPSATTGSAGGIRVNAATVSGTANPGGHPTNYHFDYGTTTAYGMRAPSPDGSVGSDTSDHTVRASLTGLKPSTTYHYRLVAANAFGTARGADRTFTTPAASTAYRNSVLGTAGLVSYLRLGERSGTTARDSKGQNNGTYVNSPWLGVPGALTRDADTAVSFNGHNQYVKVPRPVQDDFSLEFWFKSRGGIGSNDAQWWQGAGLLDADSAGIHNDFGTSLGADGRVLAGVGNPDRSIASPPGLNDGQWHHVVFTRTRATGAIALYVDGVRVAHGGAGRRALTYSPALRLAGLQSGAGFLAGRIDEAAVYRVALPASTIAQHYRLGKSG